MSILALLGIWMLGLAAIIGLEEINLRNEVKFDELRLLEPQRLNDVTNSAASNGFEVAETRLQSLNQCLAAKMPDRSDNCIMILLALLRENPASGRLWLEMARIRSREGKGLDDDALNALRLSYEFAPREGWVVHVRVPFVLSVWQGLTPELQNAATADVLEALRDDDSLAYLSNLYATNPISRLAIAKVIIKAPVETQRVFMDQMRRRIQN